MAKAKKKTAAKKSAPKKAASRKGKSRKNKTPGKTIASHSYEGRKFRCYGKRVAKRGGGTSPRIFCAKTE